MIKKEPLTLNDCIESKLNNTDNIYNRYVGDKFLKVQGVDTGDSIYLDVKLWALKNEEANDILKKNKVTHFSSLVKNIILKDEKLKLVYEKWEINWRKNTDDIKTLKPKLLDINIGVENELKFTFDKYTKKDSDDLKKYIKDNTILEVY